jgi:hypothetical protein
LRATAANLSESETREFLRRALILLNAMAVEGISIADHEYAGDIITDFEDRLGVRDWSSALEMLLA